MKVPSVPSVFVCTWEVLASVLATLPDQNVDDDEEKDEEETNTENAASDSSQALPAYIQAAGATWVRNQYTNPFAAHPTLSYQYHQSSMVL